MLTLASATPPTSTRPANPPPMPAEITPRYGEPATSASASNRAVPAAAAAGPTPTVPNRIA